MTKKTLSALKYGVTPDMISHDALYVIEKLHKHGFDGYIVGGGIRDLLIDKTPKDFDIVTDATPEQVRKIFKQHSIIIGRRFKIVHIVFSNINPDKMIGIRPITERHIIEVSTYRSNKIHNQHVNEHGKLVVDNNYGTLDEDSDRRDFTVNALYYDPIAETIIDYHNGINDIKNKTIRMIGNPHDRYMEDPVRILRAIRLSVKLGLTIDDKTAECINEVKHLLKNEHKGRLYEEMLKILLSGHARACIETMQRIAIPRQVFILLDKLFFTAHPDAFAQKIVIKTDERLQQGSDISTIFILAGLMWNMVYHTWQEMLNNGIEPKQALFDAIYLNKDFAYNLGVPKNAYSCMRDVWLLQLEFENPNSKKLDQLLANSRFRQAWHLYSTRNELGQVDPKLSAWWDKFMATTDDNERIALHQELDRLTDSNSKPSRKRNKIKPTSKIRKQITKE